MCPLPIPHVRSAVPAPSPHPLEPVFLHQLLPQRLPQLRQAFIGPILAEARVAAGQQLGGPLQRRRRRLPVHDAWRGRGRMREGIADGAWPRAAASCGRGAQNNAGGA